MCMLYTRTVKNCACKFYVAIVCTYVLYMRTWESVACVHAAILRYQATGVLVQANIIYIIGYNTTQIDIQASQTYVWT